MRGCTSCVIRICHRKFKDGLARTMADVKSEICRNLDVKYLTFLTSKDDFLVAATDQPGNKIFLPI